MIKDNKKGEKKKMALWSVIESTGAENAVIWKHPEMNFVTGSTLIVRETQQALFFYQGQLVDTFNPGKYKLSTETLPIIGKLQTIPTKGESPFIAEIYFISTAVSLDMKWGTTSQALVMDQTFGLLLHIGACGTLGLKLMNPALAFCNLVGTGQALTYEQIQMFFRENITQKVKEYIAQAFSRTGMSFITLDQNLSQFSKDIEERLNAQTKELGIEIYNFVISTLNLPEEEYGVIMYGQQDQQVLRYANQSKLMTANTDAEVERIMAKAKADSRQMQGYSWQDEQKAAQGLAYANNPNVVSNPASLLAQAPLAMNFGQMLNNNLDPLLNTPFSDTGSGQFQNGTMFGGMSGNEGFVGFSMGMEPLQPDEYGNLGKENNEAVKMKFCSNCGQRVALDAKFCPECGTRLN